MQKIVSTILLTLILIPVVTYAQSFTDVPETHPYAPAIEWAKETGVLQGYPDGTFKSDQPVNRAEFLKIVLEAKGVDVSNMALAQFTDVQQGAWYVPYVSYAKVQGIIEGYSDGTFRPEQTVSFAEGLKMAYQTLDVPTSDTGGEWYERYLQHAKEYTVLFDTGVDVSTGMQRKDVVWIAYQIMSRANAWNSKEDKKPYVNRPKKTEATSSKSTILKKNPTSSYLEEQLLLERTCSLGAEYFDIALKFFKDDSFSIESRYGVFDYLEPFNDKLTLICALSEKGISSQSEADYGELLIDGLSDLMSKIGNIMP